MAKVSAERSPLLRSIVLALLLATVPSSGFARACGQGAGGFGSWLAQFKAHAAAQGISSGTISSALGGISYDPKVIRLDRSQHSFKLSFNAFYARRVGGALIGRGRSRMNTHRGTLDRVESQFGVPREIVIAIWGLETNYGADTGSRFSILRSLATLAYDCRRSPFFTGQLLDALRIVNRGDIAASELRGGWAGEIGQTQFLPTAYVAYAVDFDGDGRRDLTRSIPDVLASTANFLKGHGWKPGQPWGPGTANHAVIKEWNKAEVYQRTIAVMAGKLRGGS